MTKANLYVNAIPIFCIFTQHNIYLRVKHRLPYGIVAYISQQMDLST